MIVAAADVNHDGCIDRVEYLRRMSEAFFFVDTNKNGFLTSLEQTKEESCSRTSVIALYHGLYMWL